MIYEDKVFKVKEYDNFPFKKDNDEVIKTFETLEEAQFESMWLNKKARLGERYYVMDFPHEQIELSNNEKERLRKRFPQAIGR